MKYFTIATLVLANDMAKKRGYNRQLTDKILELGNDLKFPIIFHMIHEHAAGVKVAPHVRCIVAISPGSNVQIDCDYDLYNALPSIKLK